MTRVFVPGDAAAVSVGADEVAAAFEAAGAQVVRNGSRGMLWLEPLVEVETDRGRVGHANVLPADVAAVLAGEHADIGVVDEHPWLTSQERVSFRRVGVVDPASVADYEAHGGWAGLRRALTLTPAQVVQEVTDSGLRGRGGAGFPAGIKWKTVMEADSDLKFVACNFDEGDSGTFADRMVVEGDPFTLIEGMTIAAYAVGASEGYVYVRSEYPHAIAALRRAVDAAYTHGYLGADVLGSGHAFDLHVRVGAGAYICGEESSMLESLEGRRGEVRAKPPIPALKGLWGRPTAVNNVLTLCAVPMVLADGGEAYAAHGVGRSRGTQVFQLAGNVKQGGIVELPFGVSLRELVEDYGGGTLTGRPARAAQVGGPLGAYVPATGFDVAMGYEELAEAGAMLGHGGVVVFDDSVDMARMARFAMEFCSIESCGKCTPCRVGSTRGVETIDRIIAGRTTRDVGTQPGPPGGPLRHHDEGVAVRDGRADPDARAERDQALPRGLRAAAGTAGSTRMTLTHGTDEQSIWGPELDWGTPAVQGTDVTVTIDGREVTVAEGTSVLRAATAAGVPIPKLCATDSLKAFGSCRMCLVEVDGAKGVPASCTTPCADGMKVSTQTETVRALRRNVMELYLSDHPEDCDGCARGNCELQAMAATVGSAEVRYGRPGDARGGRAPAGARPEQPLLRLRRLLLHRLLALRARLRRHPGHVRAHRRGPRLRLQDQRRRHRLPRLRVRLVRRVRPGLPDLRAPGALGRPARHADPLGRDHLRLLRRRLLVPRRGQGLRRRRRGRADGPVQERRRQRGPLVRQGPVRLRLRLAPGPPALADGARLDRRRVAQGLVGRGHRAASPRASRRSSRRTAWARSAASPRAAAPTRRSTSSRRWSGRRSATTTSTPARGSATPPPATASSRPSAPRPAPRTSARSSRPT